jgi:hypothetical protein
MDRWDYVYTGGAFSTKRNAKMPRGWVRIFCFWIFKKVKSKLTNALSERSMNLEMSTRGTLNHFFYLLYRGWANL